MLRTDLDHFLGEELAMAWAGDGVSSTCCCFLEAMAVSGQLFTPRS